MALYFHPPKSQKTANTEQNLIDHLKLFNIFQIN